MRKSCILLALYLVTAVKQANSDMCDATALATLENNVSSIPQALQVLGDCLTYLDSQSFQHVTNDGTSYCATNPKDSPELQLAHMESHLAALEQAQSTYCCSEEECKAGCPPPSAERNTCDPNCKPHAPAFIETLEVKPRIQNIANRLQALTPIIANPGASTCTAATGGSSTPQKTSPPSGQTGEQPIQVTGLDNGTKAPAKKTYLPRPAPKRRK